MVSAKESKQEKNKTKKRKKKPKTKTKTKNKNKNENKTKTKKRTPSMKGNNFQAINHIINLLTLLRAEYNNVHFDNSFA